MSCALTQGYNLDCRDSTGGIKEIGIIEFDNVESVTLTAGVITAVDQIANFRKYQLIAHTGDFEQTVTPSRENGTLEVKQSLKFPINKMTTSVRNELLLLAQNRLMIAVLDTNGKAWLLGQDFGMMLGASSAKSGVKLGDRNGFELMFESDEKTLAYEINSALYPNLFDY